MATKQPSTSVKLRKDVWKMAGAICLANEQSLTDYLSELLRPLLQKDFPAAIKRLNQLGVDVDAALDEQARKPRKKS